MRHRGLLRKPNRRKLRARKRRRVAGRAGGGSNFPVPWERCTRTTQRSRARFCGPKECPRRRQIDTRRPLSAMALSNTKFIGNARYNRLQSTHEHSLRDNHQRFLQTYTSDYISCTYIIYKFFVYYITYRRGRLSVVDRNGSSSGSFFHDWLFPLCFLGVVIHVERTTRCILRYCPSRRQSLCHI